MKYLARPTLGPCLFPVLAGLLLGGCGFPGPLSPQDREALDDCRSQADRAYAAQNRYQLSERDSRDTPFSGGGQVATPSDGLADQFAHEQRVSDCVHHGDLSVEPVAPAAARTP